MPLLMKMLLPCLLLALLGSAATVRAQQSAAPAVRYDGFYQTAAAIDASDGDTTYYYIRFYPDGHVISVGSSGTAADLKAWFGRDKEDLPAGTFSVRGRRVHFATTSRQGTVVYDGEITADSRLWIKSRSLINGYRSREMYYFISIPDLK